MANYYYLVLDSEDPGSEHDSWEEAKKAKDDYERKHGIQPDARIISPKSFYGDDSEYMPLWEGL